MFKKVLVLAMAMVLGTAGYAFAGCSAQEAQEKGQAFSQAAMELAQKDPAKYAEVAQAMQNDLPGIQQTGDMDKLCKFYDDWTAKMK